MSTPSHDAGRSLPRWAQVLALLAAFVMGAWLFGGVAEQGTPTLDDHAHPADTVWTCAMHPQIRQSEPGSCPICGMDLIRAVAASSGSSDPDRVVLSDRAKALSRVRTVLVQRRPDAVSELRLLGRVEPAESTRRNVATWIGGRIDRLHVNTTGERVRRGQVIATMYSPEAYAAHQDLITAKHQVERLAGSGSGAREAAEAALGAARERLRLLGVPDDEVTTMAKAEVPAHAIPIRSPFRGTVIERVATEGAYVETGATLYRVADLSTLWVQLDAYDNDLSRLSVGQAVDVVVQAYSGQTFTGRVAFIDPTLDAQRRTAQVRVEVDNPDGQLRPGMFAEAVVSTAQADGDEPLVIPDTAPLFTGTRSVVYVELASEEGHVYVPRTVRLGPRRGDVYPVVSGLSEGERVVARGAFSLDADLQIRGGPSMMMAADEAQPTVQVPVTLAPADRAQLAPPIEAYVEVQRSLAEDELASAVAAAARLSASLDEVRLPEAAQAAWMPLAEGLRGHAQHVAHATDVEGAREGFEALSLAVEAVLRRMGNPLSVPLRVAYCPMAMGSEGARWVQEAEQVDNAYFGEAMRDCGEIRDTVAPGAHLTASAPDGGRTP